MTYAVEEVEPIAVVGMACRVPGADTVDRFWRNMRDGVESISRFSAEELIAAGVDAGTVAEPDYVPAAGVVDGADRFDAAFFGYNPREAEIMDPQQRLLCEVAWAALEDSAHDPARFAGTGGVFAGTFMNKYLLANLSTNARFQRSPMAPLARTFNDKDFLATRLAFLFDLHGPAYTVQTACSTSLVATHLAVQSLLSYECDLALVGGVTVNVPLRHGYPVAAGGLFSATGHCRPFDAGADGTVPANGAVVVVLRRLADAQADRDHVYAVIRATAVNNDGSVKAGYTAPSVAGQAKVITMALAMAGVEPASIGYVEAHGTATQVGDPIEVAALTQAFRAGTAGREFCALGSVKANLGHLDAAAGIAGLMRAALALRYAEIPPCANFRSANPELDLPATPFYVPTHARSWPPGAEPRRAGVSSFGVGGTNAHAVLEEPPPVPPAGPGRPWQLVPVSARTREAVDAATVRLADHLDAHPDLSLADVAYTLQEGRRHFPVRRFVVCTDVEDLTGVLRGGQPHRLITRTAPDTAQRAVFLFPGGGTQHREMGAELYRAEPVFRAEIDRCAEILAGRTDLDLRELLFSADRPARRKALGREAGTGAVCALFAMEYALARLWLSWGVRPAAMIGHSLGEYVAACLAGVLSLEDALAVTVARGEVFTRMEPGRMLAVQAGEADLAGYLDERVSVSAVNAPALTVLAGRDADMLALLERLRAGGVECSLINVPVASHSVLVEPFLDEFAATVKECDLRPPRIPVVSCVTGGWLTGEEATDPGYWVRHLRQPVRFADGIRTVLAEPGRVLLEVGPGRALSALVGAQRIAPAPVAVPSLGHARDRLSALAHLASAVGRLWQAGVPVDWTALHGGSAPEPAQGALPRRVSLPTYPFERQRYWIGPGRTVPGEPEQAAAPPPDAGAPALAEPDPRTGGERELCEIWQDLLGVDRIGVHDDLFDAGAHSLMITQVTKELHRRGVTHLTARDVLQAPTIAVLAALVDGEHGAAVVEPALADDVVLDPAITAAGLPGPYPGPPRVVLLTGATGFVGSFLCAELGTALPAEIVCLVRAGSEAEGLDRLRASLDSYGLPVPPRLRVVLGDLAEPLLGLSEVDFDGLAGRVDAIYHCGAWVNFVRPYRALKAANVGGTAEVLRLATRGRLKPVHHISTMAVLAGAIAAGAAELREDDPLPPPIGHDTAYSQSKWVAEGLVALARERGVPVSVYRAGAVLCDSRTGAANREDYVTKVIQGCVELGLAPLREYPLAVAPVDHVARLVVALSLRPQATGRTFHAIDPAPLAWNDIFDAVRRFGYPVRSVPWDRWRRELTEQVELDDSANAMAPLLAMLGDTADRPMPRMDCGNVLTALPGVTAPPLSAAFFERMLAFFVRGGWLAPPA
jgi:thioester reductase-like protein